MFYRAVEHLRYLTILWDLEELDPASMPSIPEKQHILLAYKLLQILWFNKLPERGNQAFTIYVRDQLPDDQGPEKINKAFDSSADELADLCKEMPRPKWLKNATSSEDLYRIISPKVSVKQNTGFIRLLSFLQEYSLQSSNAKYIGEATFLPCRLVLL